MRPGAQGQRSPFNAIGERLTFHNLHHNEPRIAGLLKVVYARDVLMTQRRENFCFTLESDDAISITSEFIRKDFDGDFAL